MRLATGFFLFLTILFSQAQSADEVAIRTVLANQVDCWNDGDLECFMEGYWKSDRLMFIGSKGVTYGWQKTLDNYKKSYPDPVAMGQLTFTLITLEPLSDDFWSVVGKWKLLRQKGNLEGHFTLLFRRLGDDWVIVSDHSSSI